MTLLCSDSYYFSGSFVAQEKFMVVFFFHLSWPEKLVEKDEAVNGEDLHEEELVDENQAEPISGFEMFCLRT